MQTDLPLLTGVPAPVLPPDDPIAARKQAMAAAFDHAREQWREAYEDFICRYLMRHGDATAEEIRVAFEADSTNPQPGASKRASGAIFTKLRRRGTIVESGKRRSRIYGNDLAVYRLVR